MSEILSEAKRVEGEECCGLLLRARNSPPGRIDTALPAANVAPDRRDRFEIDPAILIRAYRAEREGGPHVVGCYHSHPGGDPSPSVEDAARAGPGEMLWLICAGPPWTARLWRSSPHGGIHGRFEPVELIDEDIP